MSASEQQATPPIKHPELYVQQLGMHMRNEMVLVGSGAARQLLGEAVRPSQDIDLAVTEEAYRHLRQQPGWERKTFPDGRARLTKGIFDVGIGWGDCSTEALRTRGWKTESGVIVASLPDVTTWKSDRATPQDIADLGSIYRRLHDPAFPPLPRHVLSRTIETATAALPEEYREDADIAIHLAASGLYITYCYGDPDIGRANQIIGELELPEYGVMATYHNGFSLGEDLVFLQQHFKAIGANKADHLDGLAADAGADAKYGDGRERDELLSANLLWHHAVMLGYSQTRATRLHTAVEKTKFDEQTLDQPGKRHPDRMVRGVTGVDLQILARANSLEAAFELFGEDGQSGRHSPARVVGKVMVQHGFRSKGAEDNFVFMDEHWDEKPEDAPDGPTIGEWLTRRVKGNAAFHHPDTGHQFPYDWTQDNPEMRRDHARAFSKIGDKMERGRIRATEGYEAAKRQTAKWS